MSASFKIGMLAFTLMASAQVIADEPFKNTDAAAKVRGSIVFQTYCRLCHGNEGKGDGRTAKMYTPPPANLTLSGLSNEQKREIISKGGAEVGRSPFMPRWGDELTEEQIADVIAYINSINQLPK